MPWVGKLNVWAPDHKGLKRLVVIPNVRCIPAFTDTLFSVDDLWQLSHLAAVFQNTQQVELRESDGTVRWSWPFSKRRGLYVWDLEVATEANSKENRTLQAMSNPPATIAYYTKQLAQRMTDSIAKIKAERAAAALSGNGTHSSRSISHVYSLTPDQAAAVMHRRLHISLERLKRLVHTTADAPNSLSTATHAHCDDCIEANAKRLPHRSKRYKPSYVGKVVHMDIVGPLAASHIHGYKYVLVLVDDHSRFKMTYNLKQKEGDALGRAREFIAAMRTTLGTVMNAPIPNTYIIGTVHCDNAAEFLSHEFKVMLARARASHRPRARRTCTN